ARGHQQAQLYARVKTRPNRSGTRGIAIIFQRFYARAHVEPQTARYGMARLTITMSTRNSRRVVGLSFLCLLAAALPALAQGVQTGAVSGLVTSLDRLPLPGVTVTVDSPALQGEREAVTDSNGIYHLTGLPAGTYRVTFAIADFQSAEREGVQVNIGAVASIDATMLLESFQQTVTVTAQMPSPLAQTSTTQVRTKRDIDLLPIGRRPVDVAELAPSVTTNTFNTSQLTLAGSFGYDNVFMVNGVDVNDNVQGTS